MDYNDYNFKDEVLVDFKDFEIRSLTNTVNTLEYMIKQKNLEINRLNEIIDNFYKTMITVYDNNENRNVNS